MNKSSNWPYVARPGYPNIAASTPWGYPTLRQTNAYRVLGHPPRPVLVNHQLHALATFFTAGLWLPVWLVVTVATQARNTRAEVEYWGKVQSYYQWELSERRRVSGG